MNQIIRIGVAPKQPKKKQEGIITVYDLEVPEADIRKIPLLYRVLHNHEVEDLFEVMPPGEFHEVMYKPALIDPQSKTIGAACKKLGIGIEALKVGRRYYDGSFQGVIVNPNVEICFTEEPKFATLKPVGERVPMDVYDLLAMSDEQIARLSKDLNLSLTLEQMQKIREVQKNLNLPYATDLMLDVYAILWCDHCNHTYWQALGQQLRKLRQATAEINNPNVLAAFLDNAGVWYFYDDYALVFGGETHNSPSKKFTFGGQNTKVVGHDRDIYQTGRGAKPIAHWEMTTVGEFVRRIYPVLGK